MQNGYGYLKNPFEDKTKYFHSIETNTFYVYAAKQMLICQEKLINKIQKKNIEREEKDYGLYR